eukprot:1428833-Alexandrium_andersonii.AAC.1
MQINKGSGEAIIDPFNHPRRPPVRSSISCSIFRTDVTLSDHLLRGVARNPLELQRSRHLLLAKALPERPEVTIDAGGPLAVSKGPSRRHDALVPAYQSHGISLDGAY